MLSVVDLGIVHRVEVAPGDGPIRVEILPTFVGCPALELIKASIADRLAAFGRPVEVSATFEVPWTSERISPDGRAAPCARPASRRPIRMRRGLRTAVSSIWSRASSARSAARAGRPWRTSSGRRSAGRSATAGLPPAVRSHQAGLTWPRRHPVRSTSSASSAPARWAPGSPSSRWRPATRSFSTTSTRRPSSAAAPGSGAGSSGARAGWTSIRSPRTPGSTAGSPRSARCADPRRADRRRPGPRHRGRARGPRRQAGDLPRARRRDLVGGDPRDEHERAVRRGDRASDGPARAGRRSAFLQSRSGHAARRGRRARRPPTVPSRSAQRPSWPPGARSPVRCVDTPGLHRQPREPPVHPRGAGDARGRSRDRSPAIDDAIRGDGYPMGPFELMDLVGLDVNLAAALGIFERLARPATRCRSGSGPSPVQDRLVADGRLGRKTDGRLLPRTTRCGRAPRSCARVRAVG